MSVTSRAKRWCFTVNDPLEIDSLLLLLDDDPLASLPDLCFLVFQLELATSGHLHLQGFLILKTQERLSWLKKAFLYGAHYEVARGTSQQARDYCCKTDTRVDGPWEFGELVGQGKRNDLLEIQAKLDSGVSDIVIADAHFGSWVRYHKGFLAYRQLKVQPRTENANIVIWGVPGTGKTTFAAQAYPDAYWKPPNSKWFDGYQGETVVIFDDFSDKWFDASLFKRICQKQPCKVEVKGGSAEYCGTINVFTSNYDPRSWYAGDTAVIRRLQDPCGEMYILSLDPFTNEPVFSLW